MGFNAGVYADTQVRPTLNRNEAHDSSMATADVGRRATLADINDKIQSLREKKYDFSEKQDREGLRDEQAAASLAKAKNEGIRYKQDTGDRQALEAANLGDLALRSGNEGAWKMATEMLNATDPNYGAILSQAPPELRPQILQGIIQKHSLSLETQRKGIELGMQGDQQVRVEKTKGSEDRLTQSAANTSRETIANAATTSNEKIAEANNMRAKAIADMGTGANQLLRQLEKDYGPEVAAKYRKDLLDSIIAENTNKGKTGGGKTQTQTALDKLKLNEGATEQVLGNLISTNSGEFSDAWFGDNDNLADFEQLRNKPGVQDLYDYIAKHGGETVVEDAAKRFVFSGEKGIIGLPLFPSGAIIGGVDAKRLMFLARDKKMSVLQMLEKYRSDLVKDGYLENESNWQF